MRALFRSMVHALEAGQPVQLVSILAASGSTPRGAGALLAVFPDGTSAGTVGGGSVEYEAVHLATELLRTGENALREFRFLPGEDLGMVCGGTVTLHFQSLPAGDGETIALLRRLAEAGGEARACWLVRRLEGTRVLEMSLADRDRADLPPGLLDSRAVLRDGWFALPAVRAGMVYIFGGGHVSQALVPILAAAGFRPAVWDDREEFASPARFPQAERLFCGPFEDLSSQLTITPEDDIVIMTRGHQADYTVLAQLLRSGARYLGCIGSRRKLALCRERLLAEGFTEAEYRRLHAPIGLNIGAETPAEIAVSVAAELIAVRAGVEPGPWAAPEAK